GLITGLKTRREVEDQLKAIVGEDEKRHTFKHVVHWDYVATVRAANVIKARDRVGVVVLAGEILDGEHAPGTIGSKSAARLLRKALDDDRIKAVVLRIHSPGASMFVSAAARVELGALRAARKPLNASLTRLSA